MRILFTGGGTGGHIYPILAISEKIKYLSKQGKTEVELYYLGAPGDFNYPLASGGIKVLKVVSAKWRRYFDLRNLIDIPKFFISIVQAFWKVFWLMPDVLFSKGSTGALPVVLACKFYRIPIIIHESDAVSGMANLISSRYAKRIGISFASAQESIVGFFKKEAKKQEISGRIALVGNPVREFLLQKDEEISQSAAKKILGFDPLKPLILVIAGSQGAVRINDFFLEIAADLILNNYQVLHQSGIKNFEEFNRELKFVLKNISSQQPYKAVAYFDKDIKDAYIAADAVVSRAGSGSIFEIAAMTKPSILIPLPESASDHQRKNAYEYAKSGACVVIEEDNLKFNIFMVQLKKLFDNPENLKSMSQAAKNFSKPESAQTLAEEIIRLGA